jgi:hypothetical protein
MTGKPIPPVSAEVKALRMVLIAMLILYGTMSARWAFVMAGRAPSLVGRLSGPLILAIISTLCAFVVPGVIYFFIVYFIFKLIGLISLGETFSSANPRYIRRIGYAVFCLAASNAVVNAINGFSRAGIFSDKVIMILYDGLGTLLLGFGLLVIARVFETAVRLQQDQNLTV